MFPGLSLEKIALVTLRAAPTLRLGLLSPYALINWSHLQAGTRASLLNGAPISSRGEHCCPVPHVTRALTTERLVTRPWRRSHPVIPELLPEEKRLRSQSVGCCTGIIRLPHRGESRRVSRLSRLSHEDEPGVFSISDESFVGIISGGAVREMVLEPTWILPRSAAISERVLATHSRVRGRAKQNSAPPHITGESVRCQTVKESIWCTENDPPRQEIQVSAAIRLPPPPQPQGTPRQW